MESDPFEDKKPPNKIKNPGSNTNRLEVSNLELVDHASMNGDILSKPTESKPQTFLINAKISKASLVISPRVPEKPRKKKKKLPII